MNLKGFRSLRQQVLSYRPGIRDAPILGQGLLIAVLFGRLFYDSWLAVLFLSPMALFWFVHRKTIDSDRNVRIIGIQFRDAMSSALTSMRAGYSAENAFVEAKKDMELLYGKKSLIYSALSRIEKGIRNNVPLEILLIQMGQETKNKDIQDFAAVFAVAKKSGGNMTDIISRTISVISEKMDVEKEIDVLISAKRMEAGIMDMVPFFIIFYISLTSPGFFEPLYHNVFGSILMTLCMGVYIFAYLMSERIVNIDV